RAAGEQLGQPLPAGGEPAAPRAGPERGVGAVPAQLAGAERDPRGVCRRGAARAPGRAGRLDPTGLPGARCLSRTLGGGPAPGDRAQQRVLADPGLPGVPGPGALGARRGRHRRGAVGRVRRLAGDRGQPGGHGVRRAAAHGRTHPPCAADRAGGRRADGEGAMRRVAIGVTTFRRPGLLATLLDSLALLRSPGGRGVQPLVVVVDNDADGSARSVAEARAAVLPWPVRYVIEPRRGISHGRNRVVAEALDAGADHVAFIDDDETASPGWLAELLRVQAAFDADAVEGPVVPRYAPDVPDWVRRGGFFEEARWPTGTPRPTAKAGNVLITRRLL